METDLTEDLSLLYYDFNNSRARLLQKKKKLTDFVIQEEIEADAEIKEEKKVQKQKKNRSAIKKKLKTSSS